MGETRAGSRREGSVTAQLLGSKETEKIRDFRNYEKETSLKWNMGHWKRKEE